MSSTPSTIENDNLSASSQPDDAAPSHPSSGDGARTERWLDRFSREEILELLRFDDRRSWAALVLNWGTIFGAMAMVAAWPNPITIILALFVIGGRQLGMSILMHEAAHRTLFKNRKVNDWVGNWLAAYPVWADTVPYRPYHLRHHAKNWTKDDPDLGLATPFPITRASLRRKIWRDLSGQTGYKRLMATLRRDLGMSAGKSVQTKSASMALRGVLITNLALLGLLTAVGHPALYLLWFGAWMTTYSLVMRIRAIAEHAMTPDPASPFQNSRTTLASWWERLFLAPNYVNYHLEHHLLMTVPHYNLPVFHRMLRERGLLESANVVRGYRGVLQLASSRVEA